jgi:two-component system, NtrC family, response regulator HydG
MKILVIDDDSYMCILLVNLLKKNGCSAKGVSNWANARNLVKKNNIDLVLCDYRLPDSDGTQILKYIKSISPLTEVIIITAYSDVRIAVSLIKSGAFDYVTKPIQPEEILQIVLRAGEKKNKDSAISKIDCAFPDNFITGKNKSMRNVMKEINIVAPTEIPVLIEGETGSGKEYVARAIHYASNRSNKPFVAVDCGAIPKDLASSELFGHVKGAFTGAVNDKTGYYEQANGGTLFLDEIGNLSYENQLIFLRTLQEDIIHKVGDDKSIKVDVRLISASNISLLDKIKLYEFRDDLYHRLNGFKIILPALRERKEDLEEFTHFFIKKANIIFNKNVRGVDKNVLDLFRNYRWYGNLRELQNIVFRTVLLSSNDVITPDLLPDEIKSYNWHSDEKAGIMENKIEGITALKDATFFAEKEVIINALQKSDFNKSKAARMLNIDRKTIYNKIKFYKLEDQVG